MDLRLAKGRVLRRIGIRQLADILPNAYRIPDSSIAKEATTLVRQLSDKYLVNHCLRTYMFGCILGHQDKLKFDRELLYVACLLHDLGLTERYATETGSFEYVGARAAHSFCIEQNMAPAKATLVHEAIALHSAVGIAHKREPEIALLHYGAGADVIGIRLDEIPRFALSEALSTYPRLDFKKLFGKALETQVDAKPNSHIAGHMALGFRKKIDATSFED